MGEDGMDIMFYQIILSAEDLTWRGITAWLGAQIGHKFENGDIVQNIIHFQFQEMGQGFYNILAVADVYRPPPYTK